MKSHLHLAGSVSLLTAALLAASATRGMADDGLEINARAGSAHEIRDGEEGSDSEWASATGKFGNTAFVGVRGLTISRQDSLVFSSTLRLSADAGPRFWEKSFSGMSKNVAQADGWISRDQVLTFASDTAYQINIHLTDPEKLFKSTGFNLAIQTQSGADSGDLVYLRRVGSSGILTETGSLPAGTYRFVTTMSVETPQVGPSYFKKGTRKSVAGVVDGSTLISFIGALTPAFLEWSDKIAGFKGSTYQVRASADEARGLLLSHAAALRLTREDKPSGFGSDFKVSPRKGDRNSYTIVPVNAARTARFTAALATAISDYKRYRNAHDDFTLLANAAVEDGHLPAKVLLHLDTRVPSLPSSASKHLAALSFFKRDKSYTAAEVQQVKERYNKAVAWCDGKTPSLLKQASRLKDAYDFLPSAIVMAGNTYLGKVSRASLSTREKEVLSAQVSFANTYWIWYD